ncbi:hypothetical protein ACSQ67_023646 [Phaseolus vulgaris]
MCSFFQISEHIQDSTVYLDAGSTESFQFLGAYPILLELGARAICSLENMCALDVVSAGFILDCCPCCLSMLSPSKVAEEIHHLKVYCKPQIEEWIELS